MTQDSWHHFRYHVLQMSISREKEHAFFIFLFLLIYFNWIYLYLLYNIVGFAIHWHESVTGVYVSPCPRSPSHLPPQPIPMGHPSALALSALFHASSLDWWSISHMVIYMLRCYSLKSSHPWLLPQNPKVFSLYLCLFCCLAHRIVIAVFLNSTCMR